ncbi:hypothetical protein EC9_26020 [Rosistilla ulvae]|uniref:Uncharacterized protein n=1 Tax=Rosistilla ulvae TaxID=1930277 RepID=A0A517M0L6_9BACT|nr:hypothetical protein EC9_26020 [Rosistilla ulvae]
MTQRVRTPIQPRKLPLTELYSLAPKLLSRWWRGHSFCLTARASPRVFEGCAAR